MSTRLDQAFARMKAEQRTGLVAFVSGGDPDLERSGEVVRAVDEGGADVIEIGVPFSDPLADGPVIQRASERALRAGATLRGVLDLVADLRKDVAAPLVLFTYANPVVRFGVEAFAARAAEVGRGRRAAARPAARGSRARRAMSSSRRVWLQSSS